MPSHKCIIVDDEPLICRLINKLGNWEDLDIEVVSICYDGESAVNEILKHKPDIVLSDIKVPIYNGIEIIEHVQKAGLHPLFIIISGYSQFEYAQRALRLKAVDYLVKPIHKDKLNDALQRCCDLLAQESEHRATAEALASVHEDLLWNDLYSKKFSCKDAEDFKEKYGTTWESRNHYVAAISVSRYELNEHHALYTDHVLSIFSSIFEKNIYFCDGSSGCIILIFSMKTDDTYQVNNIFQKLFIDIKHLEETMGAFSLTIGYSSAFVFPNDLMIYLKQAQIASDYRFEHGADAIYSYSDLPTDIYSYRNFITETFTNNIIYLAKCLDIEQMNFFLKGFKESFLKQSSHDFSGLTDFGIYLMNTVMNSTQFPEQEILRERFLFDCHFCISYDDYFQLLTQYITAIIVKKKEEEFVELSSSVKLAQDYIDEHFSEKIYLDDLAKTVCLSSTYLSAIFKKELGINITDYTNTVRCDHAKDLLKTTALSLNIIAEKVGYADEKYFQHQFKKIVGITPVQFRRIYS